MMAGDPMLFLACTIVVVLAGVYVLNPLFRAPGDNLEAEFIAETELDRLLNRKAVAYSNLRDLEFEHKMGRLSEADFRQLEAGYKNEAALILQNLDQLGASEDLDKMLEKEVASRKARLFAQVSGSGKELLRCPSCGAAIIPGKRFCADCGHQLKEIDDRRL
jgi:hypothetical protein